MTDLTVQPRTAFDLSPQTFDQALTFSQHLAASDMVPKDFKGKPENCLIAMQWGAEIGLKPLQALQSIAIINGRPSLWGDAVIALVRSSPLCEYVLETNDGTLATCKVKRRGEQEQVRTFSMTDAKTAMLLGKQGPWTTSPKRMLQMRARAFALRDVFPDVLRGLPVAEEVMDIPRDMGAVEEASQPAAPDPLLAAAEAAADKGVKDYQAFWGSASKDDRKALAAHHERLKGVAIKADEKRTVDNPMAAPIPAGKISQAIRDAKNMDELYAAGAGIDGHLDHDVIAELEAEFNQRQAQIEGATA